MPNKYFFLCSMLILTSCSSIRRQPAQEPVLEPVQVLEMVRYPQLDLKMRAGYSLETNSLKACVLYLQGLADSVQNHKPYFSHLNAAGYRVIYFDYMGQGGSEGSMNDTRVQVELPLNPTSQMLRRYQFKDRHREIPVQADFFWERYKTVKNSLGQDCKRSPKIVLGWSTGGLSAYRMAAEKMADAVILIAPGIHPKKMVGESARRWDKMAFLKQTITERTLTRNKFEGMQNPHTDEIKPTSPAHVPQFAVNLVGVASHSTTWDIEENVNGMVFLSGAEDTYVDRDATLKTLSKKAPHFKVKSYQGALHELDNEIPEVTEDLYAESVKFLDSVTKQWALVSAALMR